MNLVLVEKHTHFSTLKLNRGEKMNALSWDLIDELTESLRELAKGAEEGHVRTLIVGSSTNKVFCAGADLGERVQMTEEKVIETLNKLRTLYDAVSYFPVPTIAVIEGAAFGGGLELALACDLRVATSGAQLGLTEVNLAIIPGAGGTQRLPRLLGEARAKELIFLGKKLSGVEAAHIGLVNACSDNAWTLANVWAKELGTKGPLALRYSKEAISGGVGLPIREGLDLERECYLKLLSSNDRKEGLVAFVEKRAPQYKGN